MNRLRLPIHKAKSLIIYQKGYRSDFYSDMDCNCSNDSCWYTLLDHNFVQKCFHIVSMFKIRINRGFSCQAHNDSIRGAVKDSYHTIGSAWDIETAEEGKHDELLKECEKIFPFVYTRSYIDKIGNERIVIHCDWRG